MAEPIIVTDIRCHIGENPTWHPQEKKLYWLDIPIGTIYRYDPKNTMVEILDDLHTILATKESSSEENGRDKNDQEKEKTGTSRHFIFWRHSKQFLFQYEMYNQFPL